MATTPSLRAPVYAPSSNKEVWLTFDDGPHPSYTPIVLNALAQNGLTAVFFVLGNRVKVNPNLLKRIANEGHRIGNHSYDHPVLTSLSKASIRSQLQRTDDLIAPYIKGRKLFRPPYGAHNAAVDDIAAELGYRVVMWSVDTLDWNANYKPTGWMTHGLAQIKSRSSSVVLCHDIHKTTAENVDSFIKKIKAISKATIKPAATL